MISAADDLLPASVLGPAGRFAIEGVAGEGSSGRVLRARHPRLGVPVALKLLAPALARRPDAVRAFLGGARLLARVEHPGVVRALDAFEALGTHVLVMPWVDGATLRGLLDRRARLGVDGVRRVADDGLDALAAVHAAGVVHRDVTPSNLLLDRRGRLVLVDFGIACARDATPGGPWLVGSPRYCSPEQILGRPIDGRSDVYAFACALYELVFGRPVVDATDVAGAIAGHLRGTPRFDLPPRVPVGAPFVAWLRRCLSRTRGERPDAAAARAALRALPSRGPAPAAWRAAAASPGTATRA